MQIAEIRFHEVVLRSAGTMAGIIRCFFFSQLFCDFCQFMIRWHFGKMESADEDVGGKPLRDIQNPLMGATADEDTLSFFFDQQILLMQECVVDKFVGDFLRQAKATGKIGTWKAVAGTKREGVVDLQQIIGEDHTSVIL